MKKVFISLGIILLAHFFTINAAYCEEGIFIDSGFREEKNKMNFPKVQNQDPTPSVIQKSKKKTGFFSRKEKDTTRQTKFNPLTNKTEEVPKGYWGSLPNISGDFKYKRQNSRTTRHNDIINPQDDISQEDLKPAPVDDALFLDVIVKKDKTSNYVNDIQRTRYALASLKKCIEEQGNIQRFNACVNMVDMYSKNLKAKYQNSSESLKESYIDILSTNYHAKVLGNLMYDSNYYSRYIPTQQGKYSKDNIAAEQEKLLNKINKTLFLISNES